MLFFLPCNVKMGAVYSDSIPCNYNKTYSLNRINPKDMNKLQLEGLVKAGAFDSLNPNRKSLFESIPNFILKTNSHFLHFV